MRPTRGGNVARRGFSLIELVICIGLIGLLIALLLPAISLVQADAQTIQCASNLRQLGMAFHTYASANHEWLPNWSNWHPYPHQFIGGGVDQPQWLGWSETLQPWYVAPDNPVYNCPSFPPDTTFNYFIESKWNNCVEELAGHPYTTRAWKLTNIKMTGCMVLSGDCTYVDFYRPPFGRSSYPVPDCDKDDATSPCLAWADDNGGINIHRTGNNVLFDDDHVRTYARFDPAEITFNPTKMQAFNDVPNDP